MNINLSLSPATTIINKIAVVIYKASAPNTPVDSQEFNPPHTNPRNLTFTDVDPVAYIVNTYETTGLPTLGTLRHSFIYDPSYTSADIRATEFLKMTAGQTGYTDATWDGWEIESIERVGVGTQYNGEDVQYYISGNGYRTDGFDLKRTDDSFGDDEKFVVRWYPRITTGPAIIQSAKIFTGSEIIDDHITIDETYNGKLLVVTSDNPIVNITLKPIATIGEFQALGIVSNGGSQVTVSIQSEGATDDFQFGGKTVTEIILGQGEQIMMLTDPANGFLVFSSSSTILQAGKFVDAYDTDIEPNTMNCDGAVLDRDIYKRLWQAVQDMPVTVLVSEATWLSNISNQGCFSTGDGSTTFRLPRIYSAGVFKAADGTDRVPGQYEADLVGEFDTTIPIPTANTDSGTGGFADGTNIGDTNLPVTLNVGNENLIKTYGAYKLIRF